MRKYEEALERAKAGKPLDEVFPELKESEDERIRTRLIALVEAFGQGKYKDEMLAYLERQKEQKPIFKKGDKVIWDDEEFNILDVNETEYNVGGYRVPFSRQNELHPIEQKSAEWSEEDEDTYKRVYCLFRDAFDEWYECVFAGCYPKITKKKILAMLKSLRPKPKQEWNEEDEKMLEVISYKISQHQGNDERSLFTPDEAEFIDEVEDKLKSLRPQPHWKPSEEQMDCLVVAASGYGNSEVSDVLSSLINDLQKLL